MSIADIEFAVAHVRLAALDLNDVVEDAHSKEFPKGVIAPINCLMDIANAQENLAQAQATLIYMIVMNVNDS